MQHVVWLQWRRGVTHASLINASTGGLCVKAIFFQRFQQGCRVQRGKFLTGTVTEDIRNTCIYRSPCESRCMRIFLEVRTPKLDSRRLAKGN